nr:unnamed protein product [Spirometra erinaceieuropaei]
MVGGRNEAEFLRNLLTVLLGPPLCHNFCWVGGSKEKKSFMACPLFAVLKASPAVDGLPGKYHASLHFTFYFSFF